MMVYACYTQSAHLLQALDSGGAEAEVPEVGEERGLDERAAEG